MQHAPFGAGHAAVAVPPHTDTPFVDREYPNVDDVKVAEFLHGAFHGLSAAVVVAWRISAAFSLLAPLVFISVMFAFVAPRIAGIVLIAAAPVMFLVFVWWLPKARWLRWRWRLGPEALHLSFGVLIRRSEHVPYFRIQHIELINGPIERWLGLTTLTVTTASASGAAVLPGVAQADAPALRTALLHLAQLAVAEHAADSRDAV